MNRVIFNEAGEMDDDFISGDFANIDLVNFKGGIMDNQTLVDDVLCHHLYSNFTFEPSYGCNTTFDGLLCWPPTREGESVTLPCFQHLNDIPYDTSNNVTRICEAGGSWQNKTDYSSCTPLVPPIGPNPDPTNLEITTAVYYAGYTLSLAFLFSAFTIFLAFKELRCLRNTIHCNLMVTYILVDTCWILTSIQSYMGQSSQPLSSCITFILLHYFHLTNFFWMFVEGFYLYILVVQTFIAERIKLRIYVLIGWGLPLLVAIFWTVAKWSTQISVRPSHLSQSSGDSEFQVAECLWVNVSEYDWIYKGPVILVLISNLIFLVQIMWVLITKLRSATNPETQQSRKAAKALLVLMPLLGITYVLFLTGSKQTPYYEHLRALLISTQGFLVALLYCFLNGEVRQSIRHRWNRRRRGNNIFNCCCFCCRDGGFKQEGENVREVRSRTESIRLFTPASSVFRKRESTTSEVTTLTTLSGSNGLQTLTIPAHKQQLQSLIIDENTSLV